MGGHSIGGSASVFPFYVYDFAQGHGTITLLETIVLLFQIDRIHSLW